MPSAVAAGGGALWIGTASTKQDGNAMVRVSRIDPATLRVTHTKNLPNPNGGEGRFSWGIRQLVAGDGGVWAIDPDNGVSRLDERTGRVLATIGVDARTLTVAPDGVWTVMGDRLARIDPATNRVNKRISLPMTETGEIAAGAGSLWVAVENPGVVLQVGPGRTPSRSTSAAASGLYRLRRRCGVGGRTSSTRTVSRDRSAYQPSNREDRRSARR